MSRLLQGKTPELAPFSELVSFGHSLTTGFGGSSPEFSWPARFAKAYNAELLVYGQNGAILAYDDSNSTVDGGLCTIFKYAKRKITRTTGPYVAPWGAVSLHYGVNDIQTFGTGTGVRDAYKSALRAAIGISRTARWIQDNDAAITRGGAHSQITGQSEDNAPFGRFDYIAAVSGTANYWELAVPSDFPGGAVWVFLLSQTTNGCLATVAVDGGTPSAINGVAAATTVDNRTMALAAGIDNVQGFKVDIPASGAHTLRVTPTAITGAVASLCGFGIEAEVPPWVIVPNQYKLPSYSGVSGVPFPPGDTEYGTLNTWISGVVAECTDGKVIMPDFDAAINKTARWLESTGSLLHLNDEGGEVAAGAGIDAIHTASQSTGRAIAGSAKKGSVAAARQSVKRSVRVAATANVSITSAPASIDGITLDYFESVLLPYQTTGSEVGIYRFLGANRPMEREAFTDTNEEMYGGVEVNVYDGTTNKGTKWFCTNTTAITIGTTAITFRRKAAGTLFDHFADVGNTTTGETDLYSDSIPAGTLGFNGDKINATYAGITVAHATNTRQLRVYFGGTLIFNSTALATVAADNWDIRIKITRDTSTSVRCVVSLVHSSAAAFVLSAYTAVTGLTLTNAQILKITGTSSALTNDIVAKLGQVEYLPAA